MTKAHAHHSKALKLQQVQNMINSDTILDVENILENTGYAPILSTIRPSVDLAGFEVALRREFARLLHIYKVAADGDIYKLLEAYSLMIEAENMAIILQAIIGNNVDEEALEKILIPVGKYGMRHYRRIMENTDVQVASDLIINKKLRKAAQQALSKSNDPNEQAFLLNSALSHVSFSIISDVAPNWAKLEIEILNTLTICRSINLGIDPDEWLIPNIGSVYKQRSLLSNMGNPEDVMSYLMPTFPVPKVLQLALDSETPVITLEDEALRYLILRRYREFALYGSRKEAVLDFFSIKLAEIEDIGRILLSKKQHVPAEKIRSLLYPIYRRN